MLNEQVLRIEKPLGYMLNKQVLRVKKPTNHALKTQVYELKSRQTMHYRTQVYELNTAFLLTTSVPSTTQTAPKPLPLIRKHVSRQAHPLPWTGLGRPPLRTCSPPSLPPFPLTSPPSEGLGEAPSLWFWARFFGVCFLFFVNFFPPHFPIYALLPSKRRPFAS